MKFSVTVVAQIVESIEIEMEADTPEEVEARLIRGGEATKRLSQGVWSRSRPQVSQLRIKPVKESEDNENGLV